MVVGGGDLTLLAEVRRDAKVCDGLDSFGYCDGFISCFSQLIANPLIAGLLDAQSVASLLQLISFTFYLICQFQASITLSYRLIRVVELRRVDQFTSMNFY